jgi:predicted alpha/beta-hydrolase family hydrolase
VQGSRDAFGTEKEIRDVIKKLSLPATLCAIDGGDHSLKVPKSKGLNQQDIYAAAIERIDQWARTI